MSKKRILQDEEARTAVLVGLDDESEIHERPRKAKKPAKPKEVVIKQSYESNEEVQRWIREQAIEGRTKSEFNPTLIAGRRDGFWVLSSLTHFYEQNLITDVLSVAKSGKEASVYCCAADPATGEELLAAKVYRPRMFRSLSNDAVYRKSRAQRDGEGRAIREGRERNAKTTRGRLDQVASWIAYEFQIQQQMYQIGVDVPRPLAQVGNSVLMAYIGDAEMPAPRLQDVTLERDEAEPLFERIIANVELALMHNCIHGDLSAFNILYWQGKAWIIDFAQAIDPRHNPDVFELLERDIARVCSHFARYGVRSDPRALASDMWVRYIGGE